MAKRTGGRSRRAPSMGGGLMDLIDIVGSHLGKPEEVETFPKFPPATKSLLSKSLTPNVWKICKDLKDSSGFTLRQAIFSGCKWTNSGVGVYAGSADSFKTFSPLFDKVIEMYHGHGRGDEHKSSMDYEELNCPPLDEDEAKMIKSTRIRVARNLDGYALGTCVSKEDRAKIEDLVTSALNNLDGELKGTYYSMTKMKGGSPRKRQLIADHFLFKGGDKYLQAAGLEREWPQNRGIFHNDAKTFLVWVNEEDHLRIISMQKGSDIGAVFKRLSLAAAAIEKTCKFQRTDHLGYISTCPTNLGTGMRASFHIHLPNLGKDMTLMEAIAATYHVQVRGIHGEHSEDDSGIYDISNKRRLGHSETSLVQNMYDGAKALIAAEKTLAEGLYPIGEHLQKPSQITKRPDFPPGTTSLLFTALTPDVWHHLKNVKDKQGFTLQQAIFSGCKWTKSGVGVYAGSLDSYSSEHTFGKRHGFGMLFDKIIWIYHGYKPSDNHVSNMNADDLKCPEFPEDEAAMIKSTRIRVARNLEGYALGTGISSFNRLKVEQLVTKALKNLDGELKGTYYSMTGMTKKERRQLIADHFLFKGGDKYLQAAGLERDWPENRGIFHNDAKTFLVWVNEEDHLRIISMQKGSDIGAVFKRLSLAAAAIEKTCKFQRTDHLGYISTCPTNLGTGMRASVHIHLPNLGKDMALMEEIAAKFHVQVRGIHGEHSEDDSGIYDISNKRRLGRSEVQLVQDMYDGVKALIASEKGLNGSAPAAPKAEAEEDKARKAATQKAAEEVLKAAEGNYAAPTPQNTMTDLGAQATEEDWGDLATAAQAVLSNYSQEYASPKGKKKKSKSPRKKKKKKSKKKN